ncbi:MAG: phenylalanine--tRNA ligase subunit alpha [Paludibacteraceae bacterium]|nr:phenylalanine--tRNA ligase subunit alpha [Paludibacteraceae bacterium]
MALKDNIQNLLTQVKDLKASNAEELEALRIKYLSKKGEITALFNEFREVPNDQKRELGQMLNQLRQETEGRLNDLREKINDQMVNDQMVNRLDLTRTPDPIALGTRHPLSLVREEIEDIFSRIGFTVAQGPEVEDDKHVYGMLNFAPEHPARDMQDTFFIEKEMGVQKPTDVLLRSHTSSVQTRVMTSQKPPIRVLCPGRVYRNEAISARAHCFFHQVEGLYIDKNVSFADLREALLYFSKEMFGPETKIRLRPSYFPFTEPSAEMDISCNICGGTGCSFCKGTGWVEILGCGMVDPNVLEACGIDSKVYSGYAFGMGVERITNLKYRVKDLRLFSENDVRFLRQFEAC